MSLTLYLDECAFSYRLRQLLLEAGYTVQIPAEAEPSLIGAADEVQFAYVRASNQILLTLNAADFLQLHFQFPDHPGVLAVYQYPLNNLGATFQTFKV